MLKWLSIAEILKKLILHASSKISQKSSGDNSNHHTTHT